MMKKDERREANDPAAKYLALSLGARMRASSTARPSGVSGLLQLKHKVSWYHSNVESRISIIGAP